MWWGPFPYVLLPYALFLWALVHWAVILWAGFAGAYPLAGGGISANVIISSTRKFSSDREYDDVFCY